MMAQYGRWGRGQPPGVGGPARPGPARRALGLALLAVLFSACHPPDRPPRLAQPLPEAFLRQVKPERVRGFRVANGVHYRYLWSPVGPWAIHLVAVDLDRCGLSLRVLPAGDPPAGGLGRATVSTLAAGDPRAVAAVNGDFFTPGGRPLGWEVVAGRVLAPGTRPAVTISEEGEVRLWSSDLPGGPGAGPDPRSARWALGGFPILVRGGRAVDDPAAAQRTAFSGTRHPRTALGTSHGGRRLWLVVVDGRQPGYSQGVTLPELAGFLEGLGLEEALNLDGGGSSTLVLYDRVVNRPSDREGERPVANALAVVRDPGACGGIPSGQPPQAVESPR